MSSEVLYMRKDGVICARLEGDSFRLNHPGTRGAPRRRRPALDEAVQKVLYSDMYLINRGGF